jgi:hypothetical protein
MHVFVSIIYSSRQTYEEIREVIIDYYRLQP